LKKSFHLHLNYVGKKYIPILDVFVGKDINEL